LIVHNAVDDRCDDTGEHDFGEFHAGSIVPPDQSARGWRSPMHNFRRKKADAGSDDLKGCGRMPASRENQDNR
jgi:hypothetical protein